MLQKVQMDLRKLLFYSLSFIIIVLLLFNLRLSNYEKQFDDACKVDYSDYVKNDTCPCGNDLNQPNMSDPEVRLPDINWSDIVVKK